MFRFISLAIIIFFTSCAPEPVFFRPVTNEKNQKEIDFIKNRCNKYDDFSFLTKCVNETKDIMRCASKVDEYIKKIQIQGKIECRKAANAQFPYLEKQEIKEEEKLQEEDLEIIYENMNYFLEQNAINIFRYQQEQKKEKTIDNSKERFIIYSSRNKFMKQCEQNIYDKEGIFRQKYLDNCQKDLQPLENKKY